MHSTFKIINLGLRVSTLGARFLLLFFLAKYLKPTEVGYFGLFSATVAYALYFVGLDFYTFVAREINIVPLSEKGRLLKSQAALSLILYLLLLISFPFLVDVVDFPRILFWWFIPVLILEHINQEFSRVFIAISEQLVSSYILFVRQGFWAIIFVVFMYIYPGARKLEMAIIFWAISGVLAAAIGIWKFKKLKIQGWNLPIDWAWIKKGLSISAALLVATLALRGVHTFDRYWIKYLNGIEAVGAYVLIFSISSSLLILLDSWLFAFSYPKLIDLNQKANISEIDREVRRLWLHTIGISIVFCLVSLIILPYILIWIDVPAYRDNYFLYPWLLSAMVINGLSMVPHYSLYAAGQDKPIVYSHLFALASFLIFAWLLSFIAPSLAVPIGLNGAFLILLIWKSLAYFSLNKIAYFEKG